MLSRLAPGAHIDMVTGERYMSYINNSSPSKLNKARADEKEDSLRRCTMAPKVMFKRLFTQPEKMMEIVRDPHDFCRHLYLASCNGLLTDVCVDIL